MAFSGFPESTARFLAELSEHNDRAWFDAHRDECERVVMAPAKALVEALGPRLRELDPNIHAVPRVRASIHALERRRRFPRKGEGPYRPHLDLWFWSGKRRLWDNSGYFLRLSPARLVLATGMIEFQKETLARYREHVLDAARGALLASIVDALRADGYVVAGEGYKRTPPGVSGDHARAALLKHRGLFATRDGEHPKELGAPELVDFVVGHYARMTTLHTWLLGLHG